MFKYGTGRVKQVDRAKLSVGKRREDRDLELAELHEIERKVAENLHNIILGRVDLESLLWE